MERIIKLISPPLLEIHLSHFKNCSREDRCITSSGIHTANTFKVPLEPIAKFTDKLVDSINKKYKVWGINKDANVILNREYFPTEQIRDFYNGNFDNLTTDNSQYENNKIFTFGSFDEHPKPQRELYKKVCDNLDFCIFNETKKYNYSKKNKFLSFIDLKKSKYLIDLTGHSYSTKSFSFLASKRVYFTSRHPVTLGYEHKLKPFENYIPVKEDLSDLEEMYYLIESKPKLYESIIYNNNIIIKNEISENARMNNLIEKIIKNLNYEELI